MTPRSDIEFQTLTDSGFAPVVCAMMRALYAEDPSPGVDAERFPRTLQALLADPSRGQVMLFLAAGVPGGYALIIPYWSNEFGGTLLYVDELYVAPEFRGRGIARAFFEFLSEERPFDAVAIALEVSQANERARRLYQSLGFVPRSHGTMTRRLANSG